MSEDTASPHARSVVQQIYSSVSMQLFEFFEQTARRSKRLSIRVIGNQSQNQEQNVLREDENRRLNETGPGTPMGELMRRYWQPIAAAGELDENPDKQVRLLSEDLVLYKDGNGTFGLVDLHCPHRRADLSYGIVEQQGLRCNYHGWRYIETGKCVEQPFDDIAHPDVNYKEKLHIKAYPVRER